MSIGGFFKTIGKGALKGLDAVDKVVSHPAIMPFTMLIPWGQAKLALTLVRRINVIADEIMDETGQSLSNEARKAEFAKDFRKVYPAASDSEIDMLAAAFASVEKGRVKEEG